ncbi:unnamed protein product [Malus baccata var. baccata]
MHIAFRTQEIFALIFWNPDDRSSHCAWTSPSCIAHQDRTARKTWLILEEQFALASQKHISQLRSDLRRTTNVDGSIAEFLSGVNAIAHELELVGSPVPETEIIDGIMENVGRHYKNEVIRRAQSLDKPITYKDLEALLLAAETRFEDCSNNTVLAAVAVFVIIMLVGLVEYNKF